MLGIYFDMKKKSNLQVFIFEGPRILGIVKKVTSRISRIVIVKQSSLNFGPLGQGNFELDGRGGGRGLK